MMLQKEIEGNKEEINKSQIWVTKLNGVIASFQKVFQTK